jgi:hypothetical protein
MAQENWTEIVAAIGELMATYKAHLARDGIEAVEHYLAHDEYELALEGLCLELLKSPALQRNDLLKCVELAKRLGLDREGILDADIWSKLLAAKNAAEG